MKRREQRKELPDARHFRSRESARGAVKDQGRTGITECRKEHCNFVADRHGRQELAGIKAAGDLGIHGSQPVNPWLSAAFPVSIERIEGVKGLEIGHHRLGWRNAGNDKIGGCRAGISHKSRQIMRYCGTQQVEKPVIEVGRAKPVQRFRGQSGEVRQAGGGPFHATSAFQSSRYGTRKTPVTSSCAKHGHKVLPHIVETLPVGVLRGEGDRRQVFDS